MFRGPAEVPFEFCRCRLEAVDGVSEVFAIGSRQVMRVKWKREVASEQFDESVILFLLVCVVEHFPIVRGIVCFVLFAAGLVGAAYVGNFCRDEFFGGGCEKIAVVGWAISKMTNVFEDRVRVLVSTEGFVYGFFPWES